MSMLLTPCLCQVSNFIKGVEEDQLQSSASLGQACAYVCGVLPMRPPPPEGGLTRTQLAIPQLQLNLTGCELLAQLIHATRAHFEKWRCVERWFSTSLKFLIELLTIVPSPPGQFPWPHGSTLACFKILVCWKQFLLLAMMVMILHIRTPLKKEYSAF